MAYVSQADKKTLVALVKPVCKKYGIKASFAVRHHMTLVMTIKSGKIDFIESFVRTCKKNNPNKFDASRIVKDVDVNPYWYKDQFDGVALEFLKEVFPLLNTGNYDNSDIQSDYFDCGWYVDVNIGKWNAPYILEV